jgi:hypothetical protein
MRGLPITAVDHGFDSSQSSWRKHCRRPPILLFLLLFAANLQQRGRKAAEGLASHGCGRARSSQRAARAVKKEIRSKRLKSLNL